MSLWKNMCDGSPSKEMKRTFFPVLAGILIMVVIGILVSLLLLTHGSQDAEAREIIIGENGTYPYEDIQSIFNYYVQDGDSVFVSEGNHSARYLYLKNNLSIRGESKDRSRIILSGNNHLDFFRKTNITIENITIIQDRNPFSSTYYPFDTYRIFKTSKIFIRNCILINASIEVISDFENIEFHNNSMINSTFDMRYANNDSPLIHPVLMTNNTLNDRPLIQLIDKHDMVITNNSGGFFLINCTNITFRGITMENWSNGITVFHSSAIRIDQCTFLIGLQGVKFQDSNNITITNSIFDGSSYWPWVMLNNSHVIIENNTIKCNLYLYASKESSVQHNDFLGDKGLIILHDEFLTIRYNTFERIGLFFLEQSDPPLQIRSIEHNTVGGKPIYFYSDQSDVQVPEDAGQVLILNCHNITIENMDTGSVNFGVKIYNSSKVVIKNSTVSDSYSPIQIFRSKDMLIENCIITNSSIGIEFYETNDSIIRDCQLTRAHVSIVGMRNEIIDCLLTDRNTNSRAGIFSNGNDTITNVTVSGYSTGIRIRGENAYITKSKIVNNSVGIYLSGKDCTIINSQIYQNFDFGVQVDSDFDRKNHSIDARFNYWGSVNGPYHSEENSDGWGDNVTDGVTISNWHKTIDFVPVAEDGRGDDDVDYPLVDPLYIMVIVIIGVAILLGIGFKLPKQR